MKRIHFSVVACCMFVFFAGPAAFASMTHRYSFNDGTADDSVGHANGKLMNGATVVGGKLVFDRKTNDGINTDPATGQYLSLPTNILKTRAFTLEVWVTWSGGANWQRILDFGSQGPGADGAAGSQFIILTPGNNNGFLLGQVSIRSRGLASDYVFEKRTLSRHFEHQVVFTHDPDANVEALYVDGRIVGVADAHADPSKARYENFWIGRSQFDHDPFFAGSIDELRTYDTALSAAQVAADFAAGPDKLPAAEESNLMVWILFFLRLLF